MKRLFVLLCVLSVSLLCGCGAATAEIFAMDTVMDFTAYGSGAKDALKESREEIQRLEKLLSRTDPDSEVSRLNAAPGAPVQVDPAVAALVSAAQRNCSVTGGAFDITIAPVVSAWGFTTDRYQVPDQSQLDALLAEVGSQRITVSGNTVTLGADQSIDLGGIAKGYASDRVQEVYRACGVTSGMVSLGGNVYVRGSKPDGTAWRVGVKDPSGSADYLGILSLSDAFAITSGGYQRYFEQDDKIYHHIIDPATGYPAESGLISVTIVADANVEASNGADGAPGNGTLCDALSTALFVMGEERAVRFWRAGTCAFDMVLVTDDGRVLVTDGIADQFQETEGSGYVYEVLR